METIDPNVYILDDPDGKHTRRFRLPEYKDDQSRPYDQLRYDYLDSMKKIVQPFFASKRTVTVGHRILDYAKHLEEQGESYETIVATSRASAEQMWSLLER